MTFKTLLAALLVLVTAGEWRVSHAAQACTQADAIAAETQAQATTWPDMYASFRRYVQCDDGSVAEGFSNSVALLLSEHWDKIEELAKMGRAHHSFERFVLRHTDVTMTLDQANLIKRKAHDECPAGAKELCGRILKRMDEFK